VSEEETIGRSIDWGANSVEAQMTLDVEKLKQLRERWGWSQDQLANAAGVSVRTVQRAERDGTASRETKVCLAAALGVPHGELDAPEQDLTDAADSAPILRRSEKGKGNFQHPAQYGIGMAIGTFLYNAVTNGVSAETWFKSAFIGVSVFVVFAILRKLMRNPEPPSQRGS
jgi:transcriptional regulator with XRE-family HTH domain